MSTTPVKIALRRFVAESGEVIEADERVHPDHDVVRLHPENFRSRELSEELAIRSARVDELNTLDTRTSREPLSVAGREERKQDDFWRSTTALLERTHDDGRTAEERREQAHFDQSLAQVERIDEAALAELTDGLRESWAGRLPAER